MPKMRGYSKNAIAAKVVKSYVRNGMNQTAAARELGVSQNAVHKQIKKPEAQKILSRINEDAIRRAGGSAAKAYRRIVEAMDAKLVHKGKVDTHETDIPDAELRMKAGLEVLELTGRKKTAANSDDISKPTEIHIHYGHRRPDISAVRQES